MRIGLGTVIFVALMGPVVWFVIAGAERRKRMGLRCPRCSVLFNQVTMKAAIKTGKCARCKESVIAD